MSGKQDDKKDTGGVPPEAPSVKSSTSAPEYVVSDALRAKVNLLIPDNTAHRDRTLKALKSGKVVYIGAHKLRAAKVEPPAEDGKK